MKKLIIVLALLIISIVIVSCNVKDLISPDLVYQTYYCRLDSGGKKTLLVKPEEGILSYPDSQIHRLKDGKVLIYRNYFYIGEADFSDYHPVSGFVPTNYKSQYPYFTTDGRYMLFSMSGSIYRFDFSNSSYENITPDLGFAVHSPKLTADENHMVMVRSLIGDSGTGYPVVKSMNDSSLVLLDNAVQTTNQAVYIPGNESVYYVRYNQTNHYNGEDAIYSIKINNTHNQALAPIIWYYNLNLYLSSDERFIVTHKPQQGFYRNGHLLVRDNSTMLWREVSGVGQAALARSANILYYTLGTSIYKWDLEAGTQTRIVSGSFKGNKIKGFYSLSPSWDGKDLIFTAELGAK